MAEKLARVVSTTEIAPEVLEVQALCEDPPALSFRAGQFVSIRCGDEQRRAYTLSSSPDRKDGFELLVKLAPDGVGSHFFRGLRPGDAIPFTGPMGFFVCDAVHHGDVVVAATGSGIAAALPMIRDITERPPAQEQGRVLLYWGLRREVDMYWRERLEAIVEKSPRFSYHVCLSCPGPDWKGVHGRITEHVLEAVPLLGTTTIYLVGNGNMVRDLKKTLVDRGLDRKRQIRSEVFYPASDG
jgi:CDP-4-dehydro-6-deoxyglucose reductase